MRATDGARTHLQYGHWLPDAASDQLATAACEVDLPQVLLFASLAPDLNSHVVEHNGPAYIAWS